jgi:4-amino-4-deoxy-L-arabinose transferase-like glycosyltransferase
VQFVTIIKAGLKLSPKQAELFQVLLLCFFGILLRSVMLEQIPPALNQDEASSGYEAYSLLLTGKDRWGNRWPPYFAAWGAGQNVLYSYLSIPFIYCFGLNTLSVRIVNVIFGILTIPLIYVFTKNLLNKRSAYLTTFLLVFSPWHIMMSRWGLESNLLPFFALLGFYTVQEALELEASPKQIVTALVPWGVALYSYGTFFIVLPVLAVSLLKEYKNSFLSRKRLWAIACCIFIIIDLPIFLFLIKNSIFRTGLIFERYLPFSLPKLTSTPLRSIDPQTNLQFIFNGFQDNNVWNTIPGLPSLFMIFFPFLCLGIIKLYRNRKKNNNINLLLVWLYSCTPLFIITSLNVNRANYIFIPLLITSVIGIEQLARHLKRGYTKIAFIRIIKVWVIFSILLFITNYYFIYLEKAKTSFNYGLSSALHAASNSAGDSEKILVSKEIKLAYVYTLFFDKVSPNRFHAAKDYYIDHEGIYQVRSVGKYVFDKEYLRKYKNKPFIFVLRNSEKDVCSFPENIYLRDGWSVGRCNAQRLSKSSQ